MFGAPDLPRKPILPKPSAKRPGVGDHVTLYGGYAGLIVDIDRDGIATVAKRAPCGRAVSETDLSVSALQVAENVPLGFDEVVDRDNWKRGAFG